MSAANSTPPIEARFDAPPVGVDDLLAEAGGDLDSVEWRPVEFRGEFVDGGDVRIVNRSQHGRAGDNVASPFRLDDGRIVVVNRGFVPLGVDDVEPEPRGRSDRDRSPFTRRTCDVAVSSATRQTACSPRRSASTSQRLATQMPDGELLPFYVDLVEPAVDGFPEPIAEPELGERNHLSYAGQWFIFAACVVVGWVLAVRKSISRRRAEAVAAAFSSTSVSPGRPEVDENHVRSP